MTEPRVVNIYCDESGHPEHSAERHMILGALTCPREEVRRVAEDLRQVKKKPGVWDRFEAKWTKVSPGKIELYRDLIELFFSEASLSFRVLVADKSALRHDHFEQTHDEWYYKMYYSLLRPLFFHDAEYRVYLDIKSTHGGEKVERLHDILATKLRDYRRVVLAVSAGFFPTTGPLETGSPVGRVKRRRVMSMP